MFGADRMATLASPIRPYSDTLAIAIRSKYYLGTEEDLLSTLSALLVVAFQIRSAIRRFAVKQCAIYSPMVVKRSTLPSVMCDNVLYHAETIISRFSLNVVALVLVCFLLAASHYGPSNGRSLAVTSATTDDGALTANSARRAFQSALFT